MCWRCSLLLACVWGLLCLAPKAYAKDADADEGDARCEILFERAVKEFSIGQYARMLKFAEERHSICPDPMSKYLVGLAQANLLDAQVVTDPAEREQMRRRALQNLRVAAEAGTDFRPEWQMTIGAWIAELRREGDMREELHAEPLYDQGQLYDWLDGEQPDGPLEVPKAPPPAPQPVFPWGPSVLGAVGVGGLVAGIVLMVNGNDKVDEANQAAKDLVLLEGELPDKTWLQLAQQTQQLADEGESEQDWAKVSLIAGGAVIAASIVWYVLLEPEGKWRWAATPTGLQTTVRF